MAEYRKGSLSSLDVLLSQATEIDQMAQPSILIKGLREKIANFDNSLPAADASFMQ